MLAASASDGAEAAFDAWARGEGVAMTRTLAVLTDIATQGVFDLATLSVALRALRALA